MERLIKFFRQAKVCSRSNRQIGFEVETMFVDKLTKIPISRATSQRVMLQLSGKENILDVRGGTVTRIGLKNVDSAKGCNGYTAWLLYELGWNNLEVISLPTLTSDLDLESLLRQLQLVYRAVDQYGGVPVENSYDGFAHFDTMVMPDKRDEIWLDLDGPALCSLGHIASVHVNIDLKSVEEGMMFIERYLQLCEEKGWPGDGTESVWEYYLSESLAGYELDRYGVPPKSFDAYCRRLSEMKVVMNCENGNLEIASPALQFKYAKDVDLEMFLRSVWWRARLRVRGEKLVLELRDIPRGTDERMISDIHDICNHLGI